MLPISPRTAKSERLYQKAKLKGEVRALADEPSIKEWRHWRLINNRFPLDMVYKKSHMLVSKRIYPDLSNMHFAEIKELIKIIKELEGNYSQVVINTPKLRSIPNHFHVHLCQFYDKRKDMKL